MTAAVARRLARAMSEAELDSGVRIANSLKTHCDHGHRFDEANTYLSRGYRQCRACSRENQRRYRAARRVTTASSQATLFDLEPTDKRCTKCGVEKPLSEFRKRGGRKEAHRFRGECKACIRVRYNAYRAALGPDARRAQSMWQLYRLPWDDYQELLAVQLGRCAICTQPFSENPRLIHVDHNHACDHPGKGAKSCRACVRAILCARCNVFVGWIETGDGQVDGRIGVVLRYLGIHGAVILARVMRDVGYELFQAIGEDEWAKAGERHE